MGTSMIENHYPTWHLWKSTWSVNPTCLSQKYRTPKNEQREKRLNEIQALWLKTQIVGRVLDEKKKKSHSMLSHLREIFNNNNNNNNTYSLNKLGPNMKI